VKNSTNNSSTSSSKKRKAIVIQPAPFPETSQDIEPATIIEEVNLKNISKKAKKKKAQELRNIAIEKSTITLESKEEDNKEMSSRKESELMDTEDSDKNTIISKNDDINAKEIDTPNNDIACINSKSPINSSSKSSNVDSIPSIQKSASTASPTLAKRHDKRKEVKSRYIVFVGNLPYSITKERLKEWFEKAGKIQQIKLYYFA